MSIALDTPQCLQSKRPTRSAPVSLVLPDIHRPYFLGGIGVILTLGALWGVILLLRIGILGSFTSVGLHEVNAHGHAQIFGWVGLFVMGFAYRFFPAFRGVGVPWPRMAVAGCVLMLVGIVLRAGLQPFVVSYPGVVYPALLGNAMQIVAISVFVWQMTLVVVRSRMAASGGEWFILSALAFYLLQAVVGTIYFAATAWAPDRDALLWLVATFQAPLRDLQIHGFAMMMILGVGTWILPAWFGARPVSRRITRFAAVLVLAGVIGEVAGFLAMRLIGYRWAGLWGIAAIAMTAGVVIMTWQLGALGRLGLGGYSAKFIRAAYIWLLLSLLMLLLLPVWQFVALPRLAPESDAVAMGFSHAWYGAIRHAITVGFISMMILGVASRGTLEGGVTRAGVGNAAVWGVLAGLWIPFVLVNVGCAMRVGFQAWTDVSAAAFPIAGVSGLLEFAGIAVWSVYMIGGMGLRLSLWKRGFAGEVREEQALRGG